MPTHRELSPRVVRSRITKVPCCCPRTGDCIVKRIAGMTAVWGWPHGWKYDRQATPAREPNEAESGTSQNESRTAVHHEVFSGALWRLLPQDQDGTCLEGQCEDTFRRQGL